VTDLNLRLPIALIWRKDNTSPLLTNFRTDVEALVERSRRVFSVPEEGDQGL
jgi:hypothetical protein